MENSTTFRIETGYYLQRLTPEAKKLLGSTKSEITKDEMWKKCASFKNSIVI